MLTLMIMVHPTENIAAVCENLREAGYNVKDVLMLMNTAIVDARSAQELYEFDDRIVYVEASRNDLRLL